MKRSTPDLYSGVFHYSQNERRESGARFLAFEMVLFFIREDVTAGYI